MVIFPPHLPKTSTQWLLVSPLPPSDATQCCREQVASLAEGTAVPLMPLLPVHWYSFHLKLLSYPLILELANIEPRLGWYHSPGFDLQIQSSSTPISSTRSLKSSTSSYRPIFLSQDGPHVLRSFPSFSSLSLSLHPLFLSFLFFSFFRRGSLPMKLFRALGEGRRSIRRAFFSTKQ